MPTVIQLHIFHKIATVVSCLSRLSLAILLPLTIIQLSFPTQYNALTLHMRFLYNPQPDNLNIQYINLFLVLVQLVPNFDQLLIQPFYL